MKAALLYAAASSLAMGIACGPVFDKYLKELGGGSNAFVGLIESLVGVAALISAFPVGLLVDWCPRVRVLRLGAVAGVVAAMLSAAAVYVRSPVGICTGLVLGGIATELVVSASGAIFADSIPSAQRAAAFTWREIASTLASAAGPLLVAGWSCHGMDWSNEAMRMVLTMGNLLLVPGFLLLYLFQEVPALAEGGGAVETASGKSSSCVKYIMIASDFTDGFGAGMTMSFSNLFFIDDYHFSPFQINLLSAASIFTIAFFMKALHHLSKRIGRAQTIFGAYFLSGMLCFVLARVHTLPVLLLVFLVRAGLASGTSPIDRSIFMDFTSSSSRGRWYALSSFVYASWAGSAYIGGYLSDVYGCRWAFAVTGVVYLVSSALYSPLLWLVPRKELSNME